MYLNKILYGPPKKNPPRMVWADGEKSEELVDLKDDLQEGLLEKITFKPDVNFRFYSSYYFGKNFRNGI